MARDSTPFARLLRDWMERQQPPMVAVAEVAKRLNLSRQTVWQWFNAGAVPRAQGLVNIAAHTDIPLDDLIMAAGQSTYQQEKPTAPASEEVWCYIEQATQDATVSPTVRDEVQRVIERAYHSWLQKHGQPYSSTTTPSCKPGERGS